jgi:hypothetical protein
MLDITWSTGVKNILHPINIEINKDVILCSLKKNQKYIIIKFLHINFKSFYLTPKNKGFSPGAVFSDMTFKELTCVKAKTVAATNQGQPNIEVTAIIIPTTSKSRWYPYDFYIK